MILGRIPNAARYFAAGSPFAAGIDFIRRASAENLADGRYGIGDGSIYATVQGYSTEPPGAKFPESHRRFADIQALLEGEEIIEWLPAGTLETRTPYSPEKDIVFYENVSGAAPLLLVPGLFAVFYPEDAHTPGLCAAAPAHVRKVVVKIPL